jgi:hypothetical protein
MVAQLYADSLRTGPAHRVPGFWSTRTGVTFGVPGYTIRR